MKERYAFVLVGNCRATELIVCVGLAVFTISVAAQVSVTLPTGAGIPLTVQSLAVFVIAGLCQPRVVLIILLVYLLSGVAGLPVFAEHNSGLGRLSGPTGGFLYGFLPAGLLIAWLTKRPNSMTWSRCIATMLAGTVVLFGFGLLHLASIHGWANAIRFGLQPFWPWALTKAILAAGLVKWIRDRMDLGFKPIV